MSILHNIDTADRLRLVVHVPIAACKYFRELAGAYLFPLISATPDWPLLVLVYFGAMKEAKIRLRGSKRRKSVRKSDIRALVFSIKQNKRRKKGEEPRNVRFYDPLNVRGKTVVDVGAYAADTATYFIRRNAKKVIGFEPVRSLYEMGVRNARASRMGDKIAMVNKAISASDGENGNKFSKSFSFGLEKMEAAKQVSLRQVIKEYKLRGAILKLDCEGCEYGILHSLDRESAKAFDEIAVRCYFGYRDVVAKLKSLGYKTTYTKPSFLFANMFRTLQARGMVYARR